MNNSVSSVTFLPRKAASPGLSTTLWDSARALRLWSSIAWQARRSPARAQSPHLLVVSWAFPPNHQASAHFPKALARVASGQGVPLSVLASPRPAEPTQQGLEMLDDLPQDTRIVRVDCEIGHNNNPVVGQRLWGIPTVDGQFMTALLEAQTAFRRLAEAPPSIVLAFGPRFANFIAASYIARWANAKLALFYLDEWTINTAPFVTVGPHDHGWERRCLAQADFVSFVSEGKRRAYLEAFPSLAGKDVRVFENGWDPRPYALAPAPVEVPAPGELVIDFVGVVAPHAPIASFFETLGQCFHKRPDLRRRVVVRLTGTPTAYGEACVASARAQGIAVDLEPALPQSAAVARMMSSRALLLLLNTAYDGVIPQKTYDYLRCGAPILAYGTTSQGADFVARCNAGPVVAEGDVVGMIAALEKLQSTDRLVWATQARAEFVASRNREDIAAGLLKALIPGG